jgi:hypothetical protein
VPPGAKTWLSKALNGRIGFELKTLAQAHLRAYDGIVDQGLLFFFAFPAGITVTVVLNPLILGALGSLSLCQRRLNIDPPS